MLILPTVGYSLMAVATRKAPRGERRHRDWPKARAEHLLQFPACAACGRSKFLEVHHETPFHVDRSKELAQGNLITLCEYPTCNCHFIVGHLCNWKKWNPQVRPLSAIMLSLRQATDWQLKTPREGHHERNRLELPEDPVGQIAAYLEDANR